MFCFVLFGLLYLVYWCWYVWWYCGGYYFVVGIVDCGVEGMILCLVIVEDEVFVCVCLCCLLVDYVDVEVVLEVDILFVVLMILFGVNVDVLFLDIVLGEFIGFDLFDQLLLLWLLLVFVIVYYEYVLCVFEVVVVDYLFKFFDVLCFVVMLDCLCVCFVDIDLLFVEEDL